MTNYHMKHRYGATFMPIKGLRQLFRVTPIVSHGQASVHHVLLFTNCLSLGNNLANLCKLFAESKLMMHLFSKKLHPPPSPPASHPDKSTVQSI